ncbi:MAG: hypothetical protein ABIA04_09100 [Pseudomonadota bacterium]
MTLKKTNTFRIDPLFPVFDLPIAFDLELSKNKILAVHPETGFTSKGYQKLFSQLEYLSIPHLLSRLDPQDPIGITLPFILLIEDVLNIEINERTNYLRLIAAEFSRIKNHLSNLLTILKALEFTSALKYFTLLYKQFTEAFVHIYGEKHAARYLKIGGCSYNFTENDLAYIENFITSFQDKLIAKEKYIFDNLIIKNKLSELGIITKKLCKDFNITGPLSKASGISSDLRQSKNYLIYDKLDFTVFTKFGEDAYSRFLIRYLEMLEACKIIIKATRQISLGLHFTDFKDDIILPKGIFSYKFESAKGTCEIELHSAKNKFPKLINIKTNSDFALSLLATISIGLDIDEFLLNYISLDICPLSIDK